MNNEIRYKDTIPVLPLRDVVVFPKIVISLVVGRKLSLQALELAMKEGGRVFLVTQKLADVESPSIDDLYGVGCVANVLQMLRMPNDSIKVLVEGISRNHATFQKEEESPITATIEDMPFTDKVSDEENLAMCRTLNEAIGRYAKTNKRVGEEILAKIKEVNDIVKITDILGGSFPIQIEKKQSILETESISERVNILLKIINHEIEIRKIERKIRGRVKDQVEKSHREYLLQEQVRAIQKELGDESGNEINDLKERIAKSGMSEQAQKKCEQELKKLQQMPSMSAEASVTRTYLETLLSLPWKDYSETKNTATETQQSLDKQHYGLDKVKERISEYLAVQRRVKNGKSPILCFVGPPGVGKTSLGQSIADATNRAFSRISLGGVRDEAEIRGHRRTYIGAMPGKIINAVIRSKVKNPLILLDEIDKMSFDFRGDPASALLEVLDPEQNRAFSDHYVEVDYDLSNVMFITTANTRYIPPALLDRLEIIDLSGYTEEEKTHIAIEHLVPKQFKENGLKTTEADIKNSAIIDIIRHYTQEAGVRSLERHIGSICRKLVSKIDNSPPAKTKTETKKSKIISITPKSVRQYLGVKKYRFGNAFDENKVGQVKGLAWTESGGDLLSVEACMFPGKGGFVRTGKLGEVMRESVETAMSVVRSRASQYRIGVTTFKNNDFHIHFPAGAIPKDGPSAGIGIASAILSVAADMPVRSTIAMTGEITLRGEVLPIGGLKEKLLAAARGGIEHVILPKENEQELSEIPDSIKSKVKISLVKWIDEVFSLALVDTSKKSIAKEKKHTEKEETPLIPSSTTTNPPPLPH